jgi:hypothetical protein
MANKPTKPTSFNDFIQADRAKRNRDELASKFLGKGRLESGAGKGIHGRRGASSSPIPSLASRMGVSKKPIPTGPRAIAHTRVNRSFHHGGPYSPAPLLSRTKSASFLDSRSRAFDNEQRRQSGAAVAANGSGRNNNLTPGAAATSGINIRGAAGPYTVIASNFAVGTTAADIESVMAPIGGELVSCRLVTARPTVIAEMEFLDKAGAENVIAMFNGKKADGRTLYVHMKEGPAHQYPAGRQYKGAVQVASTRDAMDVDREEKDSERYRASVRQSQRAPPAYQDGRYGFADGDGGYPLESDAMMSDRGRDRYRR